MPLVSLYDTDAPTQLAPKSLYCSLEVSCCRFESSTPVLVQSVANVQLISQTALGLSLAVLDTSSAQNLSVSIPCDQAQPATSGPSRGMAI